MFYKIFSDLCDHRGISPSKAAEECGINKSNVSNWKNNGYVPRSDALNRIANYFGVTVDYLLGNKAESKESVDSDIRRIERARMNMPPETKDNMMRVLEAAFGKYFDKNFQDSDKDE